MFRNVINLCLWFTFGIACFAQAADPATDEAAFEWDFEKEFESIYDRLFIRQKGSLVEMSTIIQENPIRESAVDLDSPTNLVVPYTKTLFVADAIHPNPEEVLMIGLGGGGFHRLFAAGYPDSNLTSVELDRKVLQLATEYMDFKESDKNRVLIMDGRRYVRKVERSKKFDWIILDAFRGNYAPPHLKTKDFYKEIMDRLAPDGIMLVNLHNNVMLFDYDVNTLNDTFGSTTYLLVDGEPNTIAVCAEPKNAGLSGKVKSFLTSPDKNPVIWSSIFPMNIVDELYIPTVEETRLLTDDYAPAEYLNAIKRETRKLK